MDYKRTQIPVDAIITGLKKRSIVALRLAFDIYAPAINNMIAKMLNTDDRGILLTVFSQIWHSFDDFDKDETKLFTWMMKVARSLVLDIARENCIIANTDFFYDGQEPLPFGVTDMVLYRGYTIKEAAELLNWPIPEILRRMRLDLYESRQCN